MRGREERGITCGGCPSRSTAQLVLDLVKARVGDVEAKIRLGLFAREREQSSWSRGLLSREDVHREQTQHFPSSEPPF